MGLVAGDRDHTGQAEVLLALERFRVPVVDGQKGWTRMVGASSSPEPTAFGEQQAPSGRVVLARL